MIRIHKTTSTITVASNRGNSICCVSNVVSKGDPSHVRTINQNSRFYYPVY